MFDITFEMLGIVEAIFSTEKSLETIYLMIFLLKKLLQLFH